jgi:hypothetical protein
VIITDNFSSHKSALVRQKASELGIYLVYLPPYSQNLNPIEFIWKSIKRVLSISFVPNLAEMRRIITESFCRFAECKSFAGYWIEKFILNNKIIKTYADDYKHVLRIDYLRRCHQIFLPREVSTIAHTKKLAEEMHAPNSRKHKVDLV